MACVILLKNAKNWAGRYRYQGKEYVKSLGVEATDRDQHKLGVETKAFLKSKELAEKKLDALLVDLDSNTSIELVTSAVYQARTRGRKIREYRISDFSKIWMAIRRSKEPGESYKKTCVHWIDEFSSFIAKHYRSAVMMDHADEEHADEYMIMQEKRGISPKTYKDILKALRTATNRTGNPIFKVY